MNKVLLGIIALLLAVCVALLYELRFSPAQRLAHRQLEEMDRQHACAEGERAALEAIRIVSNEILVYQQEHRGRLPGSEDDLGSKVRAARSAMLALGYRLEYRIWTRQDQEREFVSSGAITPAEARQMAHSVPAVDYRLRAFTGEKLRCRQFFSDSTGVTRVAPTAERIGPWSPVL